MDLKVTNVVGPDLLQFLKCSYRFVNEEWPHASREPIPDQGFEETFRAACVTKLHGWHISQVREMHLGDNLITASGIMHEIDLVGLHEQAVAIVELKHWESTTPTKNEAIIFFAKLLDFLAANPRLVLRDICPIFISISGFEESGLAACLGLGIHPVGPGLRPLPIIVDSAQRMETEICRSAQVNDPLRGQLTDFWAILHRLNVALEATWLGNRCGYLSETTLVLKSMTCSESVTLSRLLREANADCLQLLTSFREKKVATSQ